MKVTMIGAGSVVFAKNLMTDILSLKALGPTEVALMDIDPLRLDTARRMVDKVVQGLGRRDVTVEATLDRRQALKGADYVINAVQVGMHEATLKDFDIPRKYGLKQTIADTLGVGGIFRGLRTIPVLLGITRDMEAVCPDALLLNYTNPMAILCLALAKATSVRWVGLCHSVQATSQDLATALGLPFEEMSFRVAGINHLAFFLELKHRRTDAYPALRALCEDPAFFESERFTSTWLGKVRFDLFRRLGYFVTESSEHLAEYVPWYLHHDEEVRRFDVPIDEYVRRSEANLREFDHVREALDRDEPVSLCMSHEYAASIIEAIETNRDWTFNGNVHNHGLIPNLPAEACVEVPCLVNGNGVQPTWVGDLPPQLAALIRSNINVQQLTVEAALTGNRDHVYHAVMMDPNASASLKLDALWAMTDELIDAHGEALPQFGPKRTSRFLP